MLNTYGVEKHKLQNDDYHLGRQSSTLVLCNDLKGRGWGSKRKGIYVYI